MPSSGPRSELVGFFSYSRDDDTGSHGMLSGLRRRIQEELGSQLGRTATDFRLWQDKQAIPAGALWKSQIEIGIAEAVFFIPIVTPRSIRSPNCRFELEGFLQREQMLGRNDLIFPLLYIRVPELEDKDAVEADPVLSMIARRNYVDWQELRPLSLDDPEVKRAIVHLCRDITDALLKLERMQRRAEQARVAEEKRRAEEAERLAEAERRAEAERLAEAARMAEEKRKAEEAERLAEAARVAEEKRRAEEAERFAEAERAAEEKRRAEEAEHLAEAVRVTEEKRKAAEAERLAEAARVAEEKRKAEEAERLAEAARVTEEKRKAEEAERIAEEERAREEERKTAEAAQVTREAPAADGQREAAIPDPAPRNRWILGLALAILVAAIPVIYAVVKTFEEPPTDPVTTAIAPHEPLQSDRFGSAPASPGPAPSAPGQPRFAKTACGSIADSTTNLEWYVAPDRDISWWNASTWAGELAACGGGWTLPTKSQLAALFDPAQSSGLGSVVQGQTIVAHLDPIFTLPGPSPLVWSGVGIIEKAPAFDFNRGAEVLLSPDHPQSLMHAFAVRNNQPAPLTAAGRNDNAIAYHGTTLPEPRIAITNLDGLGDCPTGDDKRVLRVVDPTAQPSQAPNIATFYVQVIACGIQQNSLSQIEQFLQSQGLTHLQLPIVTNYRKDWMGGHSAVRYYDVVNRSLATTLAKQMPAGNDLGMFVPYPRLNSAFPPWSWSHTLIVTAIGTDCGTDTDLDHYLSVQKLRWSAANFLPLKEGTTVIASGFCRSPQDADRHIAWLESTNPERAYVRSRVTSATNSGWTVLLASGLSEARANDLMWLLDVEEWPAVKQVLSADQ